MAGRLDWQEQIGVTYTLGKKGYGTELTCHEKWQRRCQGSWEISSAGSLWSTCGPGCFYCRKLARRSDRISQDGKINHIRKQYSQRYDCRGVTTITLPGRIFQEMGSELAMKADNILVISGIPNIIPSTLQPWTEGWSCCMSIS